MEAEEPTPAKRVGRYAVGPTIAGGGMAVVHLGHLVGPGGFSRLVAIKRMHPHLATDADFVSMFLDEARLAARIRHTNVVSVLDVLRDGADVFLIMDYVHGESLSRLLRAAAERGEQIDVDVALAIMVGVLHGLHAAHGTTDESGAKLNVVHRDVSPQNILIGVDGVPRVVDFGIAKATNRLQTTREGQIKGKLSYMSPEQIVEEPIDLRTDLYAASVLLWEMLTGERLFHQADVGATVAAILAGNPVAPSWKRSDVPKEIDDIVLRGLATDPKERFASAREMADALEDTGNVASPSTVGAWVETLVASELAQRARLMEELERSHAGEEGEDAAPDQSSFTQLDAERTIERAQTPEARRKAVLASVAAVLVLVPVAVTLALLPSWTKPSALADTSASAVPSERVTSMPPASASAAKDESERRAACPKGHCKPETLASGLTGASALALDGGTLYVATATSVTAIPTRGGEARKLCSAPLGAYALAVLGDNVFFAGARNIWAVPKAGGEATVTTTTPATPLGAAFDDKGAYFTVRDQVLRVEAPTKKPEVVAELQKSAYAVVTHGGYVYWSSLVKQGNVSRAPTSGGKVTLIRDGLDHPAGLAVDDDALFVAEQNAGRVHRIPLDAGESTVLAEKQNSPSGVSVSEGYVYFTSQNAGKVLHVPCSGGDVTVVAEGQAYPTAIVADEGGVYWVNSGATGAVMKVAK